MRLPDVIIDLVLIEIGDTVSWIYHGQAQAICGASSLDLRHDEYHLGYVKAKKFKDTLCGT